MISLTELIIAAVMSSAHVPNAGVKETSCLTEAIMYEAGTESYAGKTAVANVILNRTKSERFPDSVCGVVRQKGQFDYHRIKKTKWTKVDPALKQQISESVEIAIRALSGRLTDNTSGSTYFLNPKTAANVSWTYGLKRVKRIENHVFYKDPKKKT